MDGFPYPRRPIGRGRGQNFSPTLQMWENRPGRSFGPTYIKPDPVSGFYKLHVRSIPPKWNEGILRNIFRRASEPASVYMHPYRPNCPVTWGFIEYETYQEASGAIRIFQNNPLVDFEVAFARDSSSQEELDPILHLLATQVEDSPSPDTGSGDYFVEQSVNPRNPILRTVKNDQPYSVDFATEEFELPVPDQLLYKSVEDEIFKHMLGVYEAGESPTGKCASCQVSCPLACSGCTAVYYCSESCQAKDWNLHSKNCKATSFRRDEENHTRMQNGDTRQTRNELTNGYRSYDSERENRFNNKPNRDRMRNDQNGNDQTERSGFSQGRRNVTEERRPKGATFGRRNESDGGGFQGRSGQNNSRAQNGWKGQETRNFSKSPAVAPEPAVEDEDWGDGNQKIDMRNRGQEKEQVPLATSVKIDMRNRGQEKEQVPLATSVVSKTNEKTPREEVPQPGTIEKVSKTSEKAPRVKVPQPGAIEEVVIYVVEDKGLFYVGLKRQGNELKRFVDALNDELSKCKKQGSPVKDGIYGVLYENLWYRCQITCLDPLTVFYIDFGYTETVEADRLFDIPLELKSRPNFNLKMKLIEGTPEIFLNKTVADVLVVKFIEQIDDCWLVQIDDDSLKSEMSKVETSSASAAVSDSTEEIKAQAVHAEQPVTVKVEHQVAVTAEQPVTVKVEHQVAVTAEQPVTVKAEHLAAVIAEPLAPSTAVGQLVESNIAQELPEQKVPNMTQSSLSQLPAASVCDNLPFPSIFDATNFTTVDVTWLGGSSDEYYVGSPEIYQTWADMCLFFKNIIHQCEPVMPEVGSLGLAIFSGEWYRVKVVSSSPLLVYYIDCGNTEPLESEEMRKCPETHKDIPPLAHKIKLAPQTDPKYFGLPESSKINVKPLSWLADGTVLVQVEGENHIDTTGLIGQVLPPTPTVETTDNLTSPSSKTTADRIGQVASPTPIVQTAVDNSAVPSPKATADRIDQVTSPTPIVQTAVDNSALSSPKITAGQIGQVTSPTPTVQTAVDNSGLPSPKTTGDPVGQVTSPTPTVGTSTQGNLIPSRTSSVELLHEKWKLSFVPNKLEIRKNSLIGQVYSTHIPETVSFIAELDDFQSFFSNKEFDPNFKPSAGEIVGLKVRDMWERGTVLPRDELVALIDTGEVVQSNQLFKLPEDFIKIPPMAAVLTILDEDEDLLVYLYEQTETICEVVKINSFSGHRLVYVVGNVWEKTFEGELRTWEYEPLETPDPLMPGSSVFLNGFIDTNIFLVSPADNQYLEHAQAIQIDCRKQSEQFKTAPKLGDYVAFYDREHELFNRCKIQKEDKDEYVLYCIDDAVCYKNIKLADLHPLPDTLRNIPCLISQIELEGVDKVVQTEQANIYLRDLIMEKPLKLEINKDGKATLKAEGDEYSVNNKLKELLKPQVVPDADGKLTIFSLPELRIPLNQRYEFVVSQTDPLYVQPYKNAQQYYIELHPVIQSHCQKDDKPYNPCEAELCLAKYEDNCWYRCRCLKETNQGISSLMLVDYGNMFQLETKYIRRIVPEMLTTPSLAISCKIQGLPEQISPSLRSRLDKLLAVDSQFSGTFVAENDGCYDLVIDSVKEAIETNS